MLSDLEIARAAKLQPIVDIAGQLGLAEDEIDLYGRYKAKVHLDVLDRVSGRRGGKYVIVTAINPTPLGEGKTVTTVGLTQGLKAIGKPSMACLRQPSMGPTFGIKGGAAGGGYSQVVPMVDFNLHLTGDMHAVGAAHNLLAAALDARLMHETRLSDEQLARRNMLRLDIDPYTINWRRVVDVNDRALRHVVVGLGTEEDGRPRETGFEITAASEIMAILALAHDGGDMRRRLAHTMVAMDKNGRPVTAEHLGAGGAMAVIMKDAVQPNLMQTLEGSPVFVHAGPFANIAHGNSSIIADRLGVQLLNDGYVITEAGFGSECGLEKFANIKCRAMELRPDCAVLVATIRALKMHGGGPRVVPGRRLARAYRRENLELLEAGLSHLQAHIYIARRFGLPVVVAINRFESDTPAEIDMVRESALQAGAYDAVPSDVFAHGGDGGRDLAHAVVGACSSGSNFTFLYPLEATIEQKIQTIATQIYGADGVDFLPLAQQKIEQYTALGFDMLPVNMAKTPLSLSHDPELKGVPSGYNLQVRDIRVSLGAGFLYALCGEIQTMPGLPSDPAFARIDIGEDGQIEGLS